MRFQLRTLLLFAAAVPPLTAAVWYMPAVSLARNCGGNTAAMNDVGSVAGLIRLYAMNRPEQEFALHAATSVQHLQLAGIRAGWGVQDGDIWVTTKTLRLGDDGKQIVAVCSRPFRNVPEYMFRLAPPTHAVAYWDGSRRLISVQDFAALDRSAFMPTNRIAPAP